MDWKIFGATFVTIFLAEIGDKTQFAAFAAASQTKSIMAVLLATICALSLAGALGVLFGSLVGSFVDPQKMKYFSGSAFIIMGGWIMLRG